MKYKLCLYYSSKVFLPLSDNYDDFRKIDLYTKSFKNEEDLRLDKDISRSILLFNGLYRNYISAIKDKNKRDGQIVILCEDDSCSYIRPLYGETKILGDTKRLTNLINKKLSDSNDLRLMRKFLIKFHDDFFTEHNIYGTPLIANYRKLREYTNISVTTENEKKCFKQLLGVVKNTMKFYTKDEGLNSYYNLRQMNDYLDKYIDIIYDKINKTTNNSIKIDSTNCIEEKDDFINRIYEKACLEGREDALMDFMTDYNLGIIYKFFDDAKTKVKK